MQVCQSDVRSGRGGINDAERDFLGLSAQISPDPHMNDVNSQLPL